MVSKKATAQQFAKMFSRNAEMQNCPEKRLIVAILAQGVIDAQGAYAHMRAYNARAEKENAKIRAENLAIGLARDSQALCGVPLTEFKKERPLKTKPDPEPTNFFLEGRAGAFGELIGLDAQFVKEMFIKHSGVVST